MIPRSLRIPVILCLALGVLTGCPFVTNPPKHIPPPVDTGYLSQTSIINVLDNLKKSYVDMKYDEYVKLFAPNYTYIFAQQDVGGTDNNPPTWGLSEELRSAEHMFSKRDANTEGYVADQITLSFDRGPELPNDIENWTKVVLSTVYLTVITHKQDTLDPLNYEVSGDQAYLWFVKTGEFWYIVRWEDHPIQHKSLAKL